MKAIVTGATGLVGSHLMVELLRNSSYDTPRALVRSESSLCKLDFALQREGFSLDDIVYEVVDTTDYEQLRASLLEADVVFHCAAIVSLDGKEPAGQQIVSNNVELTHYVVEACLSSGRNPLLVHVSSIAALGTVLYPGMTNESTPFENIVTASAYARSKFLSENEVWRGVKMGLRAVVVNPSVILGVASAESGGLQPVLRLVVGGLPFYTDGVMGYVDVRDVARAMVMLSLDSATWGQRYVLSGGNLSYRELITLLNGVYSRSAPPLRMSKWMLQTVVAILGLIMKKPPVTSAMVGFLIEKSYYDGSLIERSTGFRYTPIEQTVRYVAQK